MAWGEGLLLVAGNLIISSVFYSRMQPENPCNFPPKIDPSCGNVAILINYPWRNVKPSAGPVFFWRQPVNQGLIFKRWGGAVDGRKSAKHLGSTLHSNENQESIVTNLPSDWCRISFINSSSSSCARLPTFQTSILECEGHHPLLGGVAVPNYHSSLWFYGFPYSVSPFALQEEGRSATHCQQRPRYHMWIQPPKKYPISTKKNNPLELKLGGLKN